jgi:hypothetical protein
LCCFYFGVKGLPEGGCVVVALELNACQRVVVLFLLNLYLQSKNNTTTLWQTFISKVKTTQPPSSKPLTPK